MRTTCEVYCDPEIELFITASIAAAEPDVGISEPYVEEFDFDLIKINGKKFHASDTLDTVLCALYTDDINEAVMESAAE